MLDQRQRKIVDKTWDAIWSSGITNPIVVLDLMATVLMARRTSPEVWRTLKESVYKDDVGGLVETIKLVRREHRLEPGSEIESKDFWPSTRALERAVAHTELLLNSSGDIIGDIFEHVLAKLATAGTFGQFRTPSHLVDFLVHLIEPADGEIVMDPACGTGSFLINAANYRRSRGTGGQYFGFEIDRTVCRIAQSNLAFHSIENGNILHADGLIERTDVRPDVILANPPFAGSVAPEVKRTIGLQTNKSELLFLRTMIDRLAEAGRAAVIVPAGVLATNVNAGVSIREHLAEDMKLEAVIELPNNAFAPYTGVKTGILVWRNEKAHKDHQVLMVRVDNDGYSLDARRRPNEYNDLPGVLELIAGRNADNPHARVSVGELRDTNYNLTPSRYIELTSYQDNVSLTTGEALEEVERSLQTLALRIAQIRETTL